MSAAAGWYPDPSGAPELRLWDGTGWTSQTMSPPQIPVQPQRVAVGVAVDQGSSAARIAAEYYGSAVPSLAAESRPGWSGPLRPAPKKRGRLIGGIAAGVVAVGALVVAIPMVMSPGSIYQRTHVTIPTKLAGYTRLEKVDSKLNADLTKSLPVTGMSLGLYGKDDHTAGVMLMVGRVKPTAKDIPGEMSESTSSFATNINGEEAIVITPFQAAAPGPLGGQMQCATFQVGAIPGATCVFVDEGAIGGIVVYQTTIIDNSLMQRLRAAIEKRS